MGGKITPQLYAARKQHFLSKRIEAVRGWWSIGDGVVHIPLRDGLEAIIDQEDVEKAGQFKWCTALHYKKFYVEAGVPEELRDRFGKHTQLHRVVMDAFLGMPHVDHRYGNTLDCRKENLRFATPSQNSINHHRHNMTGYRGVLQYGNRWLAQISANGKHLQLGRYDSPEAAAMAYNEAAILHHGDFAILNVFPKSS